MPYLQPEEYLNYGLPASTSADWITAATALIDSYCRRPGLNIIEYCERLRVTCGAQSVRLSYLPLAALGGARSPIIRIEGRQARPRRGESSGDPLSEAAWAFSIPGQWVAIDAATVDIDMTTGDLTLPPNLLGLAFNEVSVTYTAGMEQIGNDIKSACAQIVRNAQSTPALNARVSKIDTMQMQYFSSSLLDDTVKQWLRPYVATRVG